MAIHVMVIRTDGSQMCRTPFTEYVDKSLFISSQFLLPCFVKSLCILLSNFSINLGALMTRCAYICKQELKQVLYTKASITSSSSSIVLITWKELIDVIMKAIKESWDKKFASYPMRSNILDTVDFKHKMCMSQWQSIFFYGSKDNFSAYMDIVLNEAK